MRHGRADLRRVWRSGRAAGPTAPAGRPEHVGASADLEAVAAEIKEQARALDGMVRYRFGDNAELMGRGPAPGMC